MPAGGPHPIQDSHASELAWTERQESVVPVYCVLSVSVPLCLPSVGASFQGMAGSSYKDASVQGNLKVGLSFLIRQF